MSVVNLLRFLAAIGAIIGGAMMCQPARAQSGAHGDGHAEMHSKYEEWKDRRGYSCCDSSDCRPTRAQVDEHGRWVALVDGRPVIVPGEAVLPIPSPDGRSHICMTPEAVEPRCFVPGEIRG